MTASPGASASKFLLPAALLACATLAGGCFGPVSIPFYLTNTISADVVYVNWTIERPPGSVVAHANVQFLDRGGNYTMLRLTQASDYFLTVAVEWIDSATERQRVAGTKSLPAKSNVHEWKATIESREIIITFLHSD